MSATESKDDEAVESGGNVGASRWRKFTNIPAASHLMAMAIISGLSSLITYSDALDFLARTIAQVMIRLWSTLFYWVALPVGIPELLSVAALVAFTTYKAAKAAYTDRSKYFDGMLPKFIRGNFIIFGYLFFVLGAHPELHLLTDTLRDRFGVEFVSSTFSIVGIVFVLAWIFLINFKSAYRLASFTLFSAILEAGAVLLVDQFVIVPLASQ